MLKQMLALSDQGVSRMRRGIAATTISHLCIMAPVSLLMLAAMELLDRICGNTGLTVQPLALLLMAAACVLLILITQWVQYDLTYQAAYGESANRRMVLAEKLRRLPLSYFGQRDLSDLTTTIMGDCSKLERLYSNAVPGLIGTVIMFVMISVSLLVVDWRMGLCIALPVPAAALILVVARRAQVKAESRNYDVHRAAYDGVQEYLDAIQELRAAGIEQEYLDGVEAKLDRVVTAAFRNELVPGTAVTLAQLTVRFGLIAVLLFGGLLVGQGSLSVNMFILYLVVAGRVYDPFSSCFMLMAELFSALVSIDRTKDMEAAAEQTGEPVCRNHGYDIEFRNVSFSYHEEPVLCDVSFVAKQGHVTALVGPSGSGKSTVSRLAARFWDADAGQVLLGGVDVTTVEPETLYKNYAIVFQNVTLFDNTVMENIRLGRAGASDEEVLAAARAAQCEEFVARLPHGYDSNIGENGCMLSGGERQRISIARAILKDAPVVILDEATASMDAENENLVQQALSILLQGKTVLVIAHRMRTIANADQVVVLEQGRVVEAGAPDVLMRQDGLFHRLAMEQAPQR